MSASKKIFRFSNFTFWFWILLTYVVAALIWWFISLERQNAQMTQLQLGQLKKDDPAYTIRTAEILKLKKRGTTKYIAEGITFLALILTGAFFVYRSIRKQIEYASLQRNFMMAITHELKTPIATTRLSLETLLRRKLDEMQQHKLLNSALSETNRLNILTNNILLASQMEEKDFQRDHEQINLANVVENVVTDYVNRFPGRTIEAGVEKDVFVEGDELLLQIALSNLIDNALKYTPKESPVYIDLIEKPDCVELKVTDIGPGIPDAEKEKIFEKFYRSGNEATRKTKGTGLGLYLTQKIIQNHNGDIFVMDNTPHGSIFVIQL
jgi:two-component system, OmpR family, sensor histidine kinase CiaH